MFDLFWQSDAQMARLEPFFPKSHDKPRLDNRRVLSGIIFINRNGLRWRDAPAAYGPHKTLYSRWKYWREKGIFARMMAGPAAERGERTTVTIPFIVTSLRLPGSGQAPVQAPQPDRDHVWQAQGLETRRDPL